MLLDGITDVIVQPTHVINGIENDQMKADALSFRDRFSSIVFGNPLLTTEEDNQAIVRVVADEFRDMDPDTALVLMGHGTEHFANSAYSQFENMLRDLGHESTYVGTVEGFPSLDYVIRRLKIRDIKKVYVMPLMIVAGDHARNDLAGAEADSWDSILKADGFETEVIMKGLGEIDAIAEMFVKHLKKAESL